MAVDQTITLRLTIEDPIPGVAYSLQDAKNGPVGPLVAGDAPISLDVAVQVAPGPKFLVDFARREGPTRRFVYLAVGEQAGQRPSAWNRRAKIDVHALSGNLLERALASAVLEARVPGRAKDGSPACATLQPIGGWRIVE